MRTHRFFGRGWGTKAAPAAAFAAGLLSACLAHADFVYAWGDNEFGQIGNGTSDPNGYPNGNFSTPAPVLKLTGSVSMIAAGADSSFAFQNGDLYGWGTNGSGELGSGTEITNIPTPVAVVGFSGNVSAVASGYLQTLAVVNGSVYGWGDASYGELGNGISGFDLSIPTPTQVSGLSSGVTAVAAGRDYSLALKNGGIYAWGSNWHGQLGNGATTNSSSPVLVTGLSSGVTAIAAGGSNEDVEGGVPIGTFYSDGLAIKNGGVYAWGDNRFGDLGNGTTTSSLVPVSVNGLSGGVTAIAAGFGHSLAIMNGNVYSWGNNYAGAVGDGTTNDVLTPELIDPTDLKSIIAIAATGNSSFALSADGSIWDWGDNGENELGLGNIQAIEELTPQHLLPPTGYVFTSISGQGDGAFVLATVAPVPEPVSLAMLGIPAALALLRRRRGGMAILQPKRKTSYDPVSVFNNR